MLSIAVDTCRLVGDCRVLDGRSESSLSVTATSAGVHTFRLSFSEAYLMLR
jgi:hypothetical protein